jgi:hypothetical protein
LEASEQARGVEIAPASAVAQGGSATKHSGLLLSSLSLGPIVQRTIGTFLRLKICCSGIGRHPREHTLCFQVLLGAEIRRRTVLKIVHF